MLIRTTGSICVFDRNVFSCVWVKVCGVTSGGFELENVCGRRFEPGFFHIFACLF